MTASLPFRQKTIIAIALRRNTQRVVSVDIVSLIVIITRAAG